MTNIGVGKPVKADWLCSERRILERLRVNWKEASKRGNQVIDPAGVMQLLRSLADAIPYFKTSVFASNTIAFVARIRSSSAEVPQTISTVVEFMKGEAARTRDNGAVPNTYSYSEILKAWADSGLPQAGED